MSPRAREGAARAQRALTVVTPPPYAQGFIGEGHLASPLIPWGDFERTDPFIALMDDVVEPREGPLGGAHPHAGFETVTFVVEGSVQDRDEGVLEAGDVLWMTAGSGVVHNEDVHARGKVRILQLWLTLPKMVRWAEPSFQRVTRAAAPVWQEPGVVARVYAGSSGGVTSPTRTRLPVTLVDFELESGASFALDIPASFNAFLVVLEGAVRTGTEREWVERGQVGWLRPGGRAREDISERAPARPWEAAGGDSPRIEAGAAGARVLLYAGEPTGDAIVQRGPFVGDTWEDIARLGTEFHAGKFPRISELEEG